MGGVLGPAPSGHACSAVRSDGGGWGGVGV